jgi:VWFA-related protein
MAPKNLVAYFSFLFAFSVSCLAQLPTPTPLPTELPIKVITEEVKLNVSAQSAGGRFISNLKPDDLLIVEEGTPQTITSLRQVPANVVVLLDSSGGLSFVKSPALTRLTSKILINGLRTEDRVAVIQYYDRVEQISDWTSDHTELFESLDKKLYSGNRSRFADALNASVNLFSSQPIENRHLVIISDGIDTVADDAALIDAYRNVLAANVMVHVISYTQMEQEAGKKASRVINFGLGDTKPRVPKEIYDDWLRSLPITEKQRANLEAMNEAQRIISINLDREQIKLIKQRREAWLRSEDQMHSLAEETGGMFHAPEQLQTMWSFALEVANTIDSQYVVTYTPTRPFSSSPLGETRKVVVSTYKDGVHITARQKLIIKNK